MKRKCTVWLAIFVLAAVLAPGPSAGEGEDETEFDWFGSIRLRPEYNDNLSDINAGRDDKIAYVSYRVNLGASIALDRDVSVVLDGQAVGEWGEDQTPFRSGPTMDSTSARFNFYRAYVEGKNLFDTPFSLRAGRQPLVFADEWILGDLDHFGGTAWDAIVGDFEGDLVDVSVFWGKGAEMDVPEIFFDEEAADADGDWDLYGVWTSWNLAAAHKLDGALLYSLDRRKPSGSAVPFTDKRATYTVNYRYGKDTGLFAVANGAIQRGTTLDDATWLRDVDIDAKALEATLGWAFERGGGSYRVHGRWAYYSGDDPDTEENEIYNPLAQDFHGRYGFLDCWHGFWGLEPFVGGAAGIQFQQLGFEAKLANGFRITSLAQRMRTTEQPYPEEVIRSLGQEYGFIFGYDYGKNVSVDFGLAQLYPGTALKEFGTSTARRFFVNTVVRF